MVGSSAHLHHVGFVVASIADEVASFAASIGAKWDGKVFGDPLQKAQVTFLQTGCASNALIELVEPGGEDSPVRRFLQKGGGLHHLCYEVDDLDACLAARAKGAVLVRKPVPAVAFDNRRIAWIFTGQKLLIELLERRPAKNDNLQS